jgi:hypothetical protein
MGRSTETISTRVLILGLALSLLAGCAGTKETEKPTPTIDETLKKYEAGFRPSDYDPEPKTRSGRPGLTEGDVPDSAAVEPETNTSMEQVAGFRVQLFATTDIDAANAKKVEAEGEFPEEWIYVEYDPPTYKVRAGNFQSRIEADRFVKLAAGKGYKDAWPVPERVYKQPPPPPRAAPATEEQK